MNKELFFKPLLKTKSHPRRSLQNTRKSGPKRREGKVLTPQGAGWASTEDPLRPTSAMSPGRTRCTHRSQKRRPHTIVKVRRNRGGCKTRRGFKAGVPITREQMDHAHIALKSATHYCKFTSKPMYWCEVEHNKSNLRWVYSCPCGQEPGLCDAHIFLNDSDIVQKGGDQPGGQSRNEVIKHWLWQLGWSRVTSSPNQRFQCPRHRDPALNF